jgi:hypothetical protein
MKTTTKETTYCEIDLADIVDEPELPALLQVKAKLIASQLLNMGSMKGPVVYVREKGLNKARIAMDYTLINHPKNQVVFHAYQELKKTQRMIIHLPVMVLSDSVTDKQVQLLLELI